jgi:hypothetical protein
MCKCDIIIKRDNEMKEKVSCLKRPRRKQDRVGYSAYKAIVSKEKNYISRHKTKRRYDD